MVKEAHLISDTCKAIMSSANDSTEFTPKRFVIATCIILITLEQFLHLQISLVLKQYFVDHLQVVHLKFIAALYNLVSDCEPTSLCRNEGFH